LTSARGGLTNAAMTLHFIAYIDEAGDEGLGKLKTADSGGQSKWLMLGGILVREEFDRRLPAWRDEIMAMFPAKQRTDLHFRFMNHSQKVAAVEYLANKRFGVCCICSNKTTLTSKQSWLDRFKEKGYLYNYMTRFLLERMTSALRSVADSSGEDVTLKVVFSRRSNTDYRSMADYLSLMRDGKEVASPVRSIDWGIFDPKNIKVENHSRWAGLQLADIVTSAVAAGFEPNLYGHYEPRYALTLAKRFIARNKSIIDSGLTLLPSLVNCPLDTAQRKFVADLEVNWQAPGP